MTLVFTRINSNLSKISVEELRLLFNTKDGPDESSELSQFILGGGLGVAKDEVDRVVQPVTAKGQTLVCHWDVLVEVGLGHCLVLIDTWF